MHILIKVDCADGEEGMWLSEITEEELNILNPLLAEIQRNSGYFPTPEHQDNLDPLPENLYGEFPGFKDFCNRLPTPQHGFTKISEVILFPSEDVKILYM